MSEAGSMGGGHGRAAWPWVALIVIGSLGLSRAFVCAMPFAALAAYGALRLPLRKATVLVLAAWLGNQAIGFGLLHYPHTPSTVAWGIAIAGASLAALLAAKVWLRRRPSNAALSGTVGLAFAYLAYEAVLAAACLVLPSGPNAFAPGVLLRILVIDAVAFGLLLAVDSIVRVALLRNPGYSATVVH